MASETYIVVAQWDDEEEVWYTADTNVPGLVVEADTFDAFAAEARDLVPQLLVANHALPDPFVRRVPLQIIRSETIELAR